MMKWRLKICAKKRENWHFSDFELVDLKGVVEEVVVSEQTHAESMGLNIVIVEPDMPFPSIPGDAESLERSFLALINNAVKFSLHGGEVRIRFSVNENQAVVAIEDQGIGIIPEDMKNIFDRFWRIESFDDYLFDGVGLGLSIAKQVIEQHGGTISVKSAYGVGSEFSVKLPLSGQNR
ncbi:MAG: ATP-binding protein [Anaerolineales bacterium]